MIRDPHAPLPDRAADESTLPRVFLREPGWRVGIKIGSEREFCHNITPGEEAYHRLSDGELYVYSPEERLCLPCADRRGLLHFEPKGLGKPRDLSDRQVSEDWGETFDVIDP